MENRIRISSDAPWEEKVGYSRAVRVGNLVEVTGTVATEQGKVVGRDDPYQQTRFILKKIQKTLSEVDAKISDVVRTRIFVTDIRQWEAIGRAHREVFHTIRPATTMVEVQALIAPEYLVEIEVTAIIS